jgi:hypothetical protein
MALPLPKPVGPGGGILASLQAQNAVSKSMLENMYYGPNIQSEINNRNSLTEGQNIHNKYLPEEYRLANQLNQQKFDWNPKIFASENAVRNANANETNQMLPLKKQNQQNINDFYARSQEAKINSENAIADWRKTGGSSGRSTGSDDEMRYHATVKDYNPDLNEDELREARNVYAKGGDTLSSGKKLAPLNDEIQRAYNRAYMSTTTKPLITQGVRANAAESEMPVLDKYISAGRKPYGDTIFGKSPLQLKDSVDTGNKAAQNRLGDYIASDVLAFDKAALQTRIAGTESGVTIINEIMGKSKQAIDAKYPMLSDRARQRALEQVGKALKEALAARNSYGIGASNATGKKNTSSGKKPVREMTTEEIEQEIAQSKIAQSRG